MTATIATLKCINYTVGSLPPPSKMFLMGRVTYPYASAVSPLGNDGTCDEFWNGTTWAMTNITDAGVGDGTVLSTCCYDPVTKLIYGFGNWDGTGKSWVYNTLTDDYTQITQLPNSSGGNDTFAACYNGKCYIFGGMNNGVVSGFSTNILSYPINSSVLSQSYTTESSVLPYLAKDIFGCVDSSSSNLVWLGGGSTDTLDPPSNSGAVDNWLLFDMSTPSTNPVAKTSIPVKTAMAACVDIGSEILLIGGCIDGTPNTVGTNTVRVYNKAGNSWSTRTNYPIAVASARACYFNGVIYCACGFNSTGFDINADPPNSTPLVYKSSDAGNSWQLHSTVVDIDYSGTPRGAKASGGSILVAQ